MSGYKDILKKGWHPEKEGTTFKGQMKSLVGRGDKNDRQDSNHVARPISSLQDPSSFGPPPKRTGTVAPPPPRPCHSPAVTSLGHDFDRTSASAHTPAQPYGQDEGVPPPPPRPFNVDTTGLSTSNLPPPPLRRDGSGSGTGDRILPAPAYTPAAKPAPPKLPPRLPPRSNNASPASASEAPTHGSLLNQGVVNRLGAAGISVPEFGIGRGREAETPSGTTSASSGGLQSRFANVGLSSGTTGESKAPSEGTTWAQKKAALNTAAAFRKNPSTVSLSDARATASTLNNFRQRHGEQVAAGMRSANNLNESYGVTDRLAGATGNVAGSSSGEAAVQPLGILAKKKPAPPPPPPKRRDLGGRGPSPANDVPPPVPMSTRPKFP